MKKFLQLFILIAFSTKAFSQSATSISNGNWTNPLTWNCACVPTTGYAVTINHSVTLNTSMVFNSGGITINNTGSLTQDASLNRDIWINGGYFVNSGKADFRYFLISAGSISNLGSFTVSAFTNSVNFTNQGSIQMDSMYVAGSLTNSASGKITGDSLTNALGFTFTNNGRMSVNWMLNNGVFLNYNYQGGYAFTNTFMYLNVDSLMLTGSLWNKGDLYNSSTGKIRLTKNFHNYHPSKTARFDNDGNVIVLDSWYNTDTVKGGSSGYFQVQDTSANSGYMKDNFKFCDLTPATSSVDLNSGFISAGINFSCVLGITENEIPQANIYPNPSNGKFEISSELPELNVVIADLTGRGVFEKTVTKGDHEIRLNYPDGIYFVRITDPENGKSITKKLIIHN